MKKNIYLFALILAGTDMYAQQKCPKQPQCLKIGIFLPSMPACNTGNYYLTFEDNFDGNSLDLNKWSLPYQGVGSDIY